VYGNARNEISCKEGILMQKKMVRLFISLMVVLFFFDHDAFADIERNRAAFNTFKELVAKYYIFRDYKKVILTSAEIYQAEQT
jgi:hypothetical protein